MDLNRAIQFGQLVEAAYAPDPGDLANRAGQVIQAGCAVKGGGPQREINPPGNWFAPPGSNQSSSGGNETAEASGAKSR